jgi:hypothetical protein
MGKERVDHQENLQYLLMAKDHTVRVQINCGGDQVGWYFARFNGSERWEDIITLFNSPRGCDFPVKIVHEDQAQGR